MNDHDFKIDGIKIPDLLSIGEEDYVSVSLSSQSPLYCGGIAIGYFTITDEIKDYIKSGKTDNELNIDVEFLGIKIHSGVLEVDEAKIYFDEDFDTYKISVKLGVNTMISNIFKRKGKLYHNLVDII